MVFMLQPEPCQQSQYSGRDPRDGFKGAEDQAIDHDPGIDQQEYDGQQGVGPDPPVFVAS
jgi:hypothetical protein